MAEDGGDIPESDEKAVAIHPDYPGPKDHGLETPYRKKTVAHTVQGKAVGVEFVEGSSVDNVNGSVGDGRIIDTNEITEGEFVVTSEDTGSSATEQPDEPVLAETAEPEGEADEVREAPIDALQDEFDQLTRKGMDRGLSAEEDKRRRELRTEINRLEAERTPARVEIPEEEVNGTPDFPDVDWESLFDEEPEDGNVPFTEGRRTVRQFFSDAWRSVRERVGRSRSSEAVVDEELQNLDDELEGANLAEGERTWLRRLGERDSFKNVAASVLGIATSQGLEALGMDLQSRKMLLYGVSSGWSAIAIMAQTEAAKAVQRGGKFGKLAKSPERIFYNFTQGGRARVTSFLVGFGLDVAASSFGYDMGDLVGIPDEPSGFGVGESPEFAGDADGDSDSNIGAADSTGDGVPLGSDIEDDSSQTDSTAEDTQEPVSHLEDIDVDAGPSGVSNGEVTEVTIKYGGDTWTDLVANAGGDPYGEDFSNTISESRDVLLDEKNGNIAYTEALLDYWDNTDDSLTWREAINNPDAVTLRVDGEDVSLKEVYSKGTHWLPEFKPDAPATYEDALKAAAADGRDELYGKDHWRTEVKIVVGRVEPWESGDGRIPAEELLNNETVIEGVKIDLNGDGEMGRAYSLDSDSDRIDVVVDDNERLVRAEDPDLGEVFAHNNGESLYPDALFSKESIETDNFQDQTPIAVNLDIDTPGYEIKQVDGEWRTDINGDGQLDTTATSVEPYQDASDRWRVGQVDIDDKPYKWSENSNSWIEVSEEQLGSSETTIENFDANASILNNDKSISMLEIARQIASTTNLDIDNYLLQLFMANQDVIRGIVKPEIFQTAMDAINGGSDLTAIVDNESGKSLYELLVEVMQSVNISQVKLPKN